MELMVARSRAGSIFHPHSMWASQKSKPRIRTHICTCLSCETCTSKARCRHSKLDDTNLSKIRKRNCNLVAACRSNALIFNLQVPAQKGLSLPACNLFVFSLLVTLLCTLKCVHSQDGVVDVVKFEHADGKLLWAIYKQQHVFLV